VPAFVFVAGLVVGVGVGVSVGVGDGEGVFVAVAVSVAVGVAVGVVWIPASASATLEPPSSPVRNQTPPVAMAMPMFPSAVHPNACRAGVVNTDCNQPITLRLSPTPHSVP
jgi:hypothetical protein